MTHVCVSELTIIGSDNGLSPGRRQAIIWTNAGILLIRPLEINFNEILIEIHTISFKKIHLKMSSGKWRTFCLGLNVLTEIMAWYMSMTMTMKDIYCQSCTKKIRQSYKYTIQLKGQQLSRSTMKSNFDNGGRSNDLCAPSSCKRQVYII